MREEKQTKWESIRDNFINGNVSDAKRMFKNLRFKTRNTVIDEALSVGDSRTLAEIIKLVSRDHS